MKSKDKGTTNDEGKKRKEKRRQYRLEFNSLGMISVTFSTRCGYSGEVEVGMIGRIGPNTPRTQREREKPRV